MFLKGFHKTLIYCLFARVSPELSALRLQTEQGDGKFLPAVLCPWPVFTLLFMDSLWDRAGLLPQATK